jgi:hypothetical protein
VLKDRDGETYRHFGQWPRVMAGDWCGEFESRHKATRDSGARTRHVGPCSRPACSSGHEASRQPCGQGAKCQSVQARQDGE